MRTLLFLLLLVGQLATAADIAPYEARFGRTKPVVAVAGDNNGTELVDFVIPYGVLKRSGAADVISVATRPGVMKMLPALNMQPDATLADFDKRYPDGADYVIVPAVANYATSALGPWVVAQAAKGATIVSICDGVLVVAGSGLLKGHRATGHWGSQSYRQQHFPDTLWVKNMRYVVDGKLVSSAGVSAAMPTALALVEAISGAARAAGLAHDMGVDNWSTSHNSDAFRPALGRNLGAYISGYTNQWFHSTESIGVPVTAGMDEISLAFTADAWARSKRSIVLSVAPSFAPLATRSGLTLVPDRVAGAAGTPEVLASVGALPGRALDHALGALAQRYGHRTAGLVALEFEYPAYQ
ncbi:DJ-1/PfpI family protein [Massilia glaciei]|uniref:Transcriptional regulator n=1 Tax=Massilia glaciei TaxID=1524097 RepID=A0A2U2HEG2_9BURK|nr:DJ-1/PfpI family protein [Massilia glaciei]PWF41896.1 transcriptional regulator [Massilia glaciei]